LTFDVLLDVAANRPDQRGLRISVHCLRTAAQAGAISGLLGLEGMIEKANVLAARAFGGTRRTAEYASAGNGENEGAVEGAVAPKDGLPAAGVYLNCLWHGGLNGNFDCLWHGGWLRSSFHRFFF